MASSPNLVSQIYVNIGTGFPDQVLSTSVPGPLCHVPHKRWSGNDQEEQNYFNLERWAYHLHTEPFPVGPLLWFPYTHWSEGADEEHRNYQAIERWARKTQSQGYIGMLHVPFKRWAYGADHPRPEEEEDNYRYLENWSLGFAGYPGIKGGIPPIYPQLVVQIYENVT